MPESRRILCCDGGGIRGIITLRCLQIFESRIGSLNAHFDMFAGTSTGSLIAGSLAFGLSISDLIQLYTDRRSEIFSSRLLGFLHPLVTKYDKRALHQILRDYFGEETLADLKYDILITAVDTVRSETTYFSSFVLHENDKARHGTYQKVRLRDAIEASASAPTYFPAHGRFIDGGTTVYNNPAYVAAAEALRYSSDKNQTPPQESRYDGASIQVYSFGTGMQTHAMEPDEAMKKSGLGWLKYVIGESGNQAGYLQSYVTQSELDIAEQAIDFYRYDLYLTPQVIDWAVPGSTIDPETLALDAIDDERFELMNELGKKYGEYLFPVGFTLPPQPVAPMSTIAQADVLRRTGASGRWDQHGKPPLRPNYLDEVLAQFDEIDRKFD